MMLQFAAINECKSSSRSTVTNAPLIDEAGRPRPTSCPANARLHTSKRLPTRAHIARKANNKSQQILLPRKES